MRGHAGKETRAGLGRSRRAQNGSRVHIGHLEHLGGLHNTGGNLYDLWPEPGIWPSANREHYTITQNLERASLILFPILLYSFSYWGATYNLVAWSSGCAVTAFLWRRGLICIFFLMAVLHIITATTACFLQVSMIPSKQL